jgi:DNA-binding transcriptional LysR family regulator
MQQDFLYILKVYEEGSFSKAAEKLFLTQPALSIAIQRIENAIGMPLFDRTRRPLQPTPAGKIYIDMIRKMNDLEQDLNQQIQDIRELNTGHLKIGGSHYLNAYILPSVLTSFSQAYPGIEIEMIENSSDKLSILLAERQLDLTFSCNPDFMRDFEKYPAFYDHILLAIPVSNPLHNKVPEAMLTSSDIINGRHLEDHCPDVSLDQFHDLEYILLTPGNNLHDRCLQMFQQAGFTPKIKLMLSQLVTAYHMADSGYAAAFVSDLLIHSPTNQLVFYKLRSDLINRLFYILLPNRIYTSHAAKMFIQHFLVQESRITSCADVYTF